jgi:hypothetical protein
LDARQRGKSVAVGNSDRHLAVGVEGESIEAQRPLPNVPCVFVADDAAPQDENIVSCDVVCGFLMR